MKFLKSKKFWVQIGIVMVLCLTLSTVAGATGLNPKDTTGLQTQIASSGDTFALAVRGAAGVVAAVMLIWAGLLFFTAGGDAQKIQASKDRIKWVFVAFAVILLADKIVGLFYGILGGTPT